ncbi:MAG: hypothetical protein ABW106_16505 [Steroidobacteraceae bacterium]
MDNEPSLPEIDPGLDAVLDHMLDHMLDHTLAAAFRAPEVPSDLRAHVMAAIARDRTPDEDRCRRELEKDYRDAIATLNAKYLRRCRDALVAGSVVVVMSGSAIGPLSLWLAQFFADSAPLVAGSMALGMGLFCGGIVLRDLFGRMGIHAH